MISSVAVKGFCRNVWRRALASITSGLFDAVGCDNESESDKDL
jgi:hypothetical protein